MVTKRWNVSLPLSILFVATALVQSNADELKTDPLWINLRSVGEVACRHLASSSTLLTLDVTSEPNTYVAHCEDPVSKSVQITTVHTYFDDWTRISHPAEEVASTVLDVRDDPTTPQSALRICKAIDLRAQSVDVKPGESEGVFVLRCHLAIPASSGQYARLQIYVQRVHYVASPNG